MRTRNHYELYVPRPDDVVLFEELLLHADNSIDKLRTVLTVELLKELHLFSIAQLYFKNDQMSETVFLQSIVTAVQNYVEEKYIFEQSTDQPYIASAAPELEYLQQHLGADHVMTRWWTSVQDRSNLMFYALGDLRSTMSRLRENYPVLSTLDAPDVDREDSAQIILAQLKEDGRSFPPTSVEYTLGAYAALTLVLANLRFVAKIAYQTSTLINYRDRAESIFDDLFQEGALALMRSVDKFKPDGGSGVTNYCKLPVADAMFRQLNKLHSVVSISPRAIIAAYSYSTAVSNYTELHHEEPDFETKCKMAHIKPEDPKAAQKLKKFIERINYILKIKQSLRQPLDTNAPITTMEQSIEFDTTLAEILPLEADQLIIKLKFGFLTGHELSWNDISKYFKANNIRINGEFLTGQQLYRRYRTELYKMLYAQLVQFVADPEIKAE